MESAPIPDEDHPDAFGPDLFPTAGFKVKSKSSRIGHFYFGLSKDTQNMMEKQRKTRLEAAARDALTAADKGGGGKSAKKPKTMKERVAALQNMYNTGASKDSASDAYRRLLRKEAGAAKLIQQRYRSRIIYRAIRYLRLRHHGAASLQRTFRGYCGRIFARRFRIVRNGSSVKIQSTWRMHVGRKAARELRKVRTDAASRIQPIVRGWFGRRFVAWKRENNHRAVHMQKIVRGFLARCLFKRLLAKKFHDTVVVPSVIRIQALFRGFRDRQYVKQILHEKWVREVAVPAAIVIQKLVRGVQTRERARIRALRLAKSIEIQRIFRGWQSRLEWARICIANCAGRARYAFSALAGGISQS